MVILHTFSLVCLNDQMKVFMTNVHIHGWANQHVQFCQVSKGSVLTDIEFGVRIYTLRILTRHSETI